MNGRTTTLGGVLGVSVLTIVGLSTTSCDDSTFDDIATQCGFACPDPGEGVAAGNASITGYAPIDGFFRATVNYATVATGVSAEMDTELGGIQTLFGISNEELKASANLGAAITAKLQSKYKASLVVNAQPPKCAVDAKIAASLTARCQAEAECTVTPGQASFNCMGTCTVDVNASGGCEANANLRCTASGPAVTCMGECSGTCTVNLTTAASCSGNCVGTCSAACSNDSDPSGNCNGQCAGMCTGRCELSGSAAASCTGTCDGSCEYTPPTARCEGGAKAKCELNAQASATCTGSCEGEFTPPKASCDASASCEATGRAEARFQVTCTPPSVEVKMVAQAGGAAQVEVDFLLEELRQRLPRLAAVQGHARLASDAAAELSTSGKTAINTTANAVLSGDIDVITSSRIANCLPSQLDEATQVLTNANVELKKRTDSAASVGAAIGMPM
jgi:hypothetical protein